MSNKSYLIEREAKKRELPKNYIGDVQHDINYLNKYNIFNFIWVLRENGTHLYSFDMPVMDIILSLHTIEANYGNQERHYYVCYGDHSLREMDFHRIIIWLCNQHHKGII